MLSSRPCADRRAGGKGTSKRAVSVRYRLRTRLNRTFGEKEVQAADIAVHTAGNAENELIVQRALSPSSGSSLRCPSCRRRNLKLGLDLKFVPQVPVSPGIEGVEKYAAALPAHCTGRRSTRFRIDRCAKRISRELRRWSLRTASRWLGVPSCTSDNPQSVRFHGSCLVTDVEGTIAAPAGVHCVLRFLQEDRNARACFLKIHTHSVTDDYFLFHIDNILTINFLFKKVLCSLLYIELLNRKCRYHMSVIHFHIIKLIKK